MVVDVSHCMTKGLIEHMVLTYVVLVVANIQVDSAMTKHLAKYVLRNINVVTSWQIYDYLGIEN